MRRLVKKVGKYVVINFLTKFPSGLLANCVWLCRAEGWSLRRFEGEHRAYAHWPSWVSRAVSRPCQQFPLRFFRGTKIEDPEQHKPVWTALSWHLHIWISFCAATDQCKRHSQHAKQTLIESGFPNIFSTVIIPLQYWLNELEYHHVSSFF